MTRDARRSATPAATASEALFDPQPYGPGRTIRARKQPDPGVVVGNSGQWFLVIRPGKEPHPLAHCRKMKLCRTDANGNPKPWEGAWVTACGLIGGTLELPAGEVRACPKCKDRTVG